MHMIRRRSTWGNMAGSNPKKSPDVTPQTLMLTSLCTICVLSMRISHTVPKGSNGRPLSRSTNSLSRAMKVPDRPTPALEFR